MTQHDRPRLRDGVGELCWQVDLPIRVDERTAANVAIPPGRCLTLHAHPDTTWTKPGLERLAWRITGRTPVVLDELPPTMADELAAQVLRYLDWLGEVA